jgi:hypothetical protein
MINSPIKIGAIICAKNTIIAIIIIRLITAIIITLILSDIPNLPDTNENVETVQARYLSIVNTLIAYYMLSPLI